MAAPFKIELTAIQAKVLWNIVDGAMDAGSCEDGCTRQEMAALDQISRKLLAHKDDWINTKLASF